MTKKADEMTKQALDLQKSTVTCWFDAMSNIQYQAALAVDKMANQTSWITDEGRQMISDWVGTCKNERDRYKGYMEENYSMLEKYLYQNTKNDAARPQKSAGEAKTAVSILDSEAAAAEEERPRTPSKQGHPSNEN